MIAGKIHLFCVKQMIKHKKYTNESDQFNNLISECFTNIAHQYNIFEPIFNQKFSELTDGQ